MAPGRSAAKPSAKPRVIIVGAGIGGVTLAILLQKAGIPYDIFERTTDVKPLGSAISLGPNVASLFKQIGIWDEVVSISKKRSSIDVFNENRELTFAMDFSPVSEMGGYDCFVMPRAALYDTLLKQIPARRIHRGKKMLSMLQNENGVMIRCADNTVYDGDLLVGADGAYSSVRQNLYLKLKKEGKLSSSDSEPLPHRCVCLVAQTSPLDPNKFPDLSDPVCHYNNIVAADRPYSWTTLTTQGNTICWGVTQYLDKESSKENDSFRRSEWTSEAAEAMCKEVRHFPIPGGDGTLTLGDIIDNTPKDYITKVMLEEKVFETWYHGRAVLMGDVGSQKCEGVLTSAVVFIRYNFAPWHPACHKIHPAGSRGAISAIHDAVCLANWINVLQSTSLEDMEKVFKEYQSERLPAVKADFTFGQRMAHVSAKNFKAKIARYMAKNMPDWLWTMTHSKNVANRPQGTVRPHHQPSLHKTLEIIMAKETAKMAIHGSEEKETKANKVAASRTT
ncbi:hypothetical protein BGX28_003618 [Mortierella sp. GBA30]|nr:hypothetical protein BGX28_003618 [Mortierella sp. GBA30]